MGCPETSLAVPPAPVAALAFVALASSTVLNAQAPSHLTDARAGLHLNPPVPSVFISLIISSEISLTALIKSN